MNNCIILYNSKVWLIFFINLDFIIQFDIFFDNFSSPKIWKILYSVSLLLQLIIFEAVFCVSLGFILISKFEEELKSSIEEPTTPEYEEEKEKSTDDLESEEESGEEELDL